MTGSYGLLAFWFRLLLGRKGSCSNDRQLILAANGLGTAA
jgi:hypothetical protein